MSAFIVSPKQIATICNAVVFDQNNNNIFYKWIDDVKKSVFYNDSIVSFEKQFIDEINALEDEYSLFENYKLLAKILVNANFVSVQSRYPDSNQCDISIYLEEVNKLSMRDDLGSKDLNVIQFLKFIHCLHYQSCEHPEYDKSLAKKFINFAEQKAIYNSPEYQACKWEVA